ncbi:hypothetical protein BDN70DRAFT_877276 [Pholiota conissans]|uniref:Spindle pole body component n=1 Tax=Pholiota conissans TaxID=109636 RepID=A0A9P5Z3F2_9AGAR|nr:hypothetical protein BDN70DRAFT_877276 [Pholiota conissans]
MIPSSSSNLSTKSQGSRPHSSLARPISRNNSRPSSSAAHRPASSLSTRPLSSASTRPSSRFSQRPHSRHARSRLIPICQILVSQITGLQEEGTEKDLDGEAFQELVEQAVKSLETSTINKATAGVDMSVIDRQISGFTLKARINSRDVLGEALEFAYKTLKAHIDGRELDLDQDIKEARIPDHLQFLLALNQPPSSGTLELAKTYLEKIRSPNPPPQALTWAEILAEEPFEGEHWEGILGSAIGENSDKNEWDSSPSLSPLGSDDLALDDDDEGSSDYDRPLSPPSEPLSLDAGHKPSQTNPPYTYQHRTQFEELQGKQYWKGDWRIDASIESPFDIGNPSTLGPTVARVLAEAKGFKDAEAMLQPERYINEDDMVRDILMALQGNKNTILTWKENAFRMSKDTPKLVHLSLTSQESIINSLARTATTVERLRQFSRAVFDRALSPSSKGNKATSTRTCEAFADAVDEAVRIFDAWCAKREEAMCRAYSGLDHDRLVVSVLSTDRAINEEYESSFEVLLDIVYQVFQLESYQDITLFDQTTQRRQPAALTALLLDTLFANVQLHMERGDTVTSDALMRIFVRTAEPVWGMVGKWLKNGMGLGLGVGTGGKPGMADELDDEFFIESSGVGVGMMGMGLLDPEFWKEGYALREGVTYGESEQPTASGPPHRKAIPLFLEHVSQLVLETGKAVGLLRALGERPLSNAFNNWKTFSDIVSSETRTANGVAEKNIGLFSVSIDTLSRLIYDGLLPHYEATGMRLVKVLIDECSLWKHVDAIEDLLLMRRGDAVSHFVDVLFIKMDSSQSWGDFHFLNAAFADVIESNMNTGSKEWINPALVRLSYKGGRDKDRSIKRTVKAIDGLALEYSVPFPLTYIFQPKTIQRYNEVFIFLMQIRRAKSVLERILVRDERSRGKKLREELKVFYAMRSRLSWFINTLLNFVTTYVIHAEVSRFHDAFHKARSLDDMIQLHDEHLEKIGGRCLLKPNTSALHRTILSILDICLHFSEGFVAFAGDTTATLDVSRQSMIMKRHRSRLQRRQRKNIIGFSQSALEDEDSSDEEEFASDAPGLADNPPEPSYSMLGTSTSSIDEDFYGRVERMSSELDGLVRFLRRGVESLAGGTGEAASAFGVLAFSLEDWDI